MNDSFSNDVSSSNTVRKSTAQEFYFYFFQSKLKKKKNLSLTPTIQNLPDKQNNPNITKKWRRKT